MNHIAIIAGLPRCGSSLLMQMLSAAGLTCGGEAPSFEPDEMLQSPPEEFIDLFEGGALKCLDPHRIELPAGRDYRIIFLTRSRRQQAMSTVKFLSALGHVSESKTIFADGLDRMRESMAKDQAEGLRILHGHGCPILKIRFEDLIERPASTTEEIGAFLGIAPELWPVMRSVIRERKATSYPGLLEIELMKEIEERDGLAPPYDPLSCTCKIGPKNPCDYCTNGNFSISEND